MTTTDNKILAYLTAHDHATFNDLHHHTDHRIADVREAIDRLEQHGTITHTKSPLPGHDTWALTTPDTPTTPTPPTIAAVAALVEGWESYEWQIPCPTIGDKAFANGYEAATSDRARELRGALLDQQPAGDRCPDCGEPRAAAEKPTLYGYVGKPTGPGGTYQVGDEITHVVTTGPAEPTSVKLHLFGPDALRIGQSDGSTLRLPADGSPATIEDDPRRQTCPPPTEIAKAVVDELDARMRDRLRAWGLQCGNDSSSD